MENKSEKNEPLLYQIFQMIVGFIIIYPIAYWVVTGQNFFTSYYFLSDQEIIKIRQQDY